MKRIASIILLTALAACSGGGGGGGSSVVPPAASSSSSATTVRKTEMVIKIPSASSTSSKARRAYISPATESVSYQIYYQTGSGAYPTPPYSMQPYGTPTVANLTPSSPNCALVGGAAECTLAIFWPYYPNTYYQVRMTTYDGPNGTGNALSTSLVPDEITDGEVIGGIGSANTIYVVLNGVIDHWVASLPSVFTGAGTESLNVVAYDADGFVIPQAASDTASCANPALGYSSAAYAACDYWVNSAGANEELWVTDATSSSTPTNDSTNPFGALSIGEPADAGSSCPPAFNQSPYTAYEFVASVCPLDVTYSGSGSDSIEITPGLFNGSTTTWSATTYTLTPFNPTPALSVTIPAQ